MRQFYKENKVLTLCSIGAALIVLSYYITYDMPEIIRGINKWYELLVTLCVGILTNLLFYIFQVYIPRKRDEEKAYEVMHGRLRELCVLLWEIFLLSNEFMLDTSKGILQLKKREVFYKFIQSEEESSGWGRGFDFEKDVSILVDKIKKLEEQIISDREFSRCSEVLIKVVTSIERNRFLSALKKAQANGFTSGVVYGDCDNDYEPFKLCLEELRELVNPNDRYRVVELTTEEIDRYKAKLESDMPKDCKDYLYVKMYFN